MPTYLIQILGRATDGNGEPLPLFTRSGGADVDSGIGLRGKPFEVTATDRVEAYLDAYRRLSAAGTQVYVSGVNAEVPLGFSDEEIARVEAAGIPLTVKLLPPSGAVMIERIEESAIG